MSKVRLCVLACLALVTALAAQDPSDPLADLEDSDLPTTVAWPYHESHALVIGVDRYTGGWPDLPGARRDSEAVSRALTEHGFDVTAVADLTYRGIETAIRTFVQTHGQHPENRLVIYFSGHGYTLSQVYDAHTGYVVAADAPLPERDRPGFMARSFNMQLFEMWAREIQAKHALFVFDSCFSGSFFTRGDVAATLDMANNPVRWFITSGSANERVPDQSIFCRQFVAALRGEGDLNDNGWVSGVELGVYLYERVVNYSRGEQHPQYGKIRDSQLDKGDILFQVPAAAGSPSPAMPAAIPPAESSPPATEFVIAVAPFWGPTAAALEDGVVMKGLIESNIYDITDGVSGLRFVHESLDRPVRSHDQAREAGRAVGASLVIWGEVFHLLGDVEIQPHITRMASYTRALDRAPTALVASVNIPDHIALRRGKAEEITNLALLAAGSYFQNRDPVRAAEFLSRSAPPTAESLRLLAASQLANNDTPGAIASLERAIAADPHDVTLHVSLARVHSHATRFAVADSILARAIEIDPQSPWPYIWRGSIRYDAGQYAEAERIFAQVPAADPGDSYQGNLDLGQFCYRTGRYEEALAHFQRAAEAEPEAPDPLRRTATILIAQGDYAAAAATLRKALAISEWVWAQNQLGGVHIILGEYDQAIAALERAATLEPGYQWTYQNLGCVLLLLDRCDEALAAFERAREGEATLIQNAMFQHLALHRCGRGDEASELASTFELGAGDRDVSSTIMRMFAGRARPEDVWKATRVDSERVRRLNACEAEYFLGMTYLYGAAPEAGIAAPDPQSARAHLQAAVDTQVYVFMEYHLAKVELAKLTAER